MDKLEPGRYEHVDAAFDFPLGHEYQEYPWQNKGSAFYHYVKSATVLRQPDFTKRYRTVRIALIDVTVEVDAEYITVYNADESGCFYLNAPNNAKGRFVTIKPHDDRNDLLDHEDYAILDELTQAIQSCLTIAVPDEPGDDKSLKAYLSSNDIDELCRKWKVQSDDTFFEAALDNAFAGLSHEHDTIDGEPLSEYLDIYLIFYDETAVSWFELIKDRVKEVDHDEVYEYFAWERAQKQAFEIS